jgi:glycosyltransferase involved in cell wall biosynthesis
VTSAIPSPDLIRGPTHEAMAERAARSGIRRLHLLAFRDLGDPEAGGSEEHAAQMARHLALAGLEVTHHTGRVVGEPEEIVRDGVRVVRRGGRVGVFPRTVRDERGGRMGPADGIIEIFHGVPFFAPLWARRVPQVGLVHHVHLGTWHHLLPQPAAAVGHLVERFVVPAVYRRRQLITIAASSRDEVLHAYGADPDRVSVLVNGVDARFTPGGTRSPEPLVVAVARLMPQKGVDELLAAFAIARAAVPTSRLVVVGSGPERAALEATAARLGLADAVRFTGYVPEAELVDWYRRAWVVASASHREGFGLTLLEAAACGTPSVVRRIPGHVDAVLDGVTGLLADGVPALGAALVEVLSDDALRASLADAALAHARGCRWEHTAQGALEALCADADRRR